MNITIATLAFSGTLLASLLLTPVARRIAWKYDFVDRPDGLRKVHTRPVPVGGGVVLLLSLLATLATLYFADPQNAADILVDYGRTTGVLLASAVAIVAVGVWDDKLGMRGRTKLLVQVLIAVLLIGSGWGFSAISLGSWSIDLGVLSQLFALVWILGSINAFNLIDGSDGLAATVGTVIAISVGTVALWQGESVGGILAFALAGALVGFLPFNFAPASIYLGDGGSMLIGLMLGSIALGSCVKEAASISCAPLFVIWLIPILDSVAAFMRRVLTGRSIYSTDRGHIHHLLLTRGLGPRGVALLVGGLCATTSGAALASVYTGYEWIGPLVGMIVIGLLLVTGWFGRAEASLVRTRLVNAGRKLVPSKKSSQQVAPTVVNLEQESSVVKLQGDGRWEQIWRTLLESTQRLGVVQIRLNLFIPNIHESFYANWQSSDLFESEHVWRIERPFFHDGTPIGRVAATGIASHMNTSTGASEFLEVTNSLSVEIMSLLEDLAAAPNRSVPGKAREGARLMSGNLDPLQVAAPK